MVRVNVTARWVEEDGLEYEMYSIDICWGHWLNTWGQNIATGQKKTGVKILQLLINIAATESNHDQFKFQGLVLVTSSQESILFEMSLLVK